MGLGPCPRVKGHPDDKVPPHLMPIVDCHSDSSSLFTKLAMLKSQYNKLQRVASDCKISCGCGSPSPPGSLGEEGVAALSLACGVLVGVLGSLFCFWVSSNVKKSSVAEQVALTPPLTPHEPTAPTTTDPLLSTVASAGSLGGKSSLCSAATSMSLGSATSYATAHSHHTTSTAHSRLKEKRKK